MPALPAPRIASVLLVTLALVGPGLLAVSGVSLVPSSPGSTGSSGPGAAGLPPLITDSASAYAAGLWVSSGSIQVAGPEPEAVAHSTAGRTAEVVGAAKVMGLNGGSVLADVKVIDTVAVANASRWAHMARAHVNVAIASLLDGLITARGISPHVFSSNGARFETGLSRTLDLTIMGTRVNVDGSNVKIPLPANLGTLIVNESYVDSRTNAVVANGLHLALTGGTDIIVGHAQAYTQKGKTLAQPCLSWAEGYPLGSTALALSDIANPKQNGVMGDGSANSTMNGHVNDVPSRGVPGILSVGQTVASHAAAASIVSLPTAVAQVRSEAHDLNILDGLVTADEVRSLATALAGGPDQNVSDAGTVLVGLTVMGTPLNITPAPNTVNLTLSVDNKPIGYLIINEQTRELMPLPDGGFMGAMRINLLDLVLTASYLGLKAGDRIVVGHAISIAQCGGQGMPMMDFGDPLGMRA